MDISQVNVHFPAQYTTFYEQEWKGFNLVPESFCLDGIYYNLNDEKKTGMVTKEKNGIGNYASLPELVTIPKTVKDADDNEFKVDGNTDLLPNLTNIGDCAFIDCVKLQSLWLTSVTSIGKEAFSGCTELTDVNIGAQVKEIEEKAFNHCTKLKKITDFADKPQAFPNGLFNGIDKAQLVIYVHRTSYEAFKAADGWKDYNIQIIPEELPRFTVYLEVNNEKAGTVSGRGTYVEGTEVTVTATPKEGYHFVRWSDGETKASYSFKLTKDETLTAHFRVIPDYDEYMVFVLGERVTSANAGDILGDGVWSYDRATHTLYTMKDATYKKENAGFIQDWETDLGAMTVVVNHQITAEVETTDKVGRWAIYGHRGMKFVGSKFKFIDVRALNMMAAHTLQPLEVSNHLRLFITQGNTTEFGKSQFSTSMIFSGTPAIRVR